MTTPSARRRPPDTRASGQVLTYERKDGLSRGTCACGPTAVVTASTWAPSSTAGRRRAPASSCRTCSRRSRPACGSRRRDSPARRMTRPFTSSPPAGWRRRRPSYKPRTYEHYRYLLTHHLLPAFASLRLSQLDYAVIDRYVEAKQLGNEEIRVATLRGVALRDGHGRRKRPLANFDNQRHPEAPGRDPRRGRQAQAAARQPAREKGLRLKQQRPRGNVLEIDELEDLLAGAAEIDQTITPRSWSEAPRYARYETKASRGRTSPGAWVSPSPPRSTTPSSWSAGGSACDERSSPASPVPGCATPSSVGSTSATSTSPTALSTSRTPRPRPACARSTCSPMLRDELLAWRASTTRRRPTTPLPTRSGSRRDKDNINARVIRPAVRRANERRAQRGLPPPPARVTAHTLRRTYISMMFAARAEIPYVMAQVGHADSKVTLEIYAQVLKRRDREQIGRAFDHLLVGGAHGDSPTTVRSLKRPRRRRKTRKRRDRNTG